MYASDWPASDTFLDSPRLTHELIFQVIGRYPTEDIGVKSSFRQIEKNDHLLVFPPMVEGTTMLERTVSAKTFLDIVHNPHPSRMINTFQRLFVGVYT